MLYDSYGIFCKDQQNKSIYWYTYPKFDFISKFVKRPKDAPGFDATPEEVRAYCGVGNDWDVVYREDEPLDNEWLVGLLENIWWPIGRVVNQLWFRVRRWLITKMLHMGDWDNQFIEVPDASLLPDHDYAMVDAIYQELIDAYGREGYYVHTEKDKIIEAALQKIYDDWWSFERPKWIEAIEGVDTWFLLEYSSAKEFIAVLKITEELYRKFDDRETYYLCEIIKHRRLLSH